MRTKKILLRLSLAIAALVLTAAIPMPGQAAETETKAVATKQDANVVKGKVLGVSKKARSITIEGKNGPVMVRFNDATKGMEFAGKGEAAIVKFTTENGNKVATVIKPKIAELPTGVAEMQPEELATLVALGPERGNYMLIDARPEGAYSNGHIKTAHSVPVAKMKESGKELMPMDNKDIQLIFYCGGVT